MDLQIEMDPSQLRHIIKMLLRYIRKQLSRGMQVQNQKHSWHLAVMERTLTSKHSRNIRLNTLQPVTATHSRCQLYWIINYSIKCLLSIIMLTHTKVQRTRLCWRKILGNAPLESLSLVFKLNQSTVGKQPRIIYQRSRVSSNLRQRNHLKHLGRGPLIRRMIHPMRELRQRRGLRK